MHRVMRILYVTPRQSWPLTSGAKLRDYYFLKSLAKHAEIDLLAFSDGEHSEQALAILSEFSNPVFVAAPQRYTLPNIVRGAVTGIPLPVLNYSSGEMVKQLGLLLGQNSYDAIHLDSIHTGNYASIIANFGSTAPTFVNWHNIESELIERYSERAALARSLYASLAASKLRKFEDRILNTTQGHVVCSDRERDLLKCRTSSARIVTIENGVDVSQYKMNPVHAGAVRRLVFVGSMNYHANIEGVLYFVSEVWPLVKNRYPDLVLTIVGSSPSPEILQLAEDGAVEVTGTVDDVRPYYVNAFAAIVPLLTGGGTRLKILEAMAAGVPVVTTALGREGLATRDSEHLLTVDGAQEWASAFGQLHDSTLRTAMTTRARDLVQRKYDWSVLGEDLFRTYAGWLEMS